MKKNWILIAAAAAGVWFLLGFRKKEEVFDVPSSKPTRDEIIAYVLNAMNGSSLPFPPSYVLAVIHRESSFDPDAIGRVGERGLMQLTSPAVKDVTALGTLNVQNYQTDWRHNVNAGIAYLGLTFKWTGSVAGALMAYNIGIGNYRNGKRLDEGRAYVTSVERLRDGYKLYD